MGVGAVLSQRFPNDNKLHPVRSSLTVCLPQSNYDIGNRELLAVKMNLEEWKHWLEGAEKPFLVWTDQQKTWSILRQQGVSTPGRRGGGTFLLTFQIHSLLLSRI